MAIPTLDKLLLVNLFSLFGDLEPVKKNFKVQRKTEITVNTDTDMELI